jgi:hypothetical protein
MRCIGCNGAGEGYAVIPGLGETGEIRFYCDLCARRDRVKMRYWDGRDLDVGGHRDTPDLGASFATLVFSFEDLGRMRIRDLAVLLEWVDDSELACALQGCPQALQERLLAALHIDRVRRVRSQASAHDGKDARQAQDAIIKTVRRL